METFELGRFTVDVVDDPASNLTLDQREELIRESIPVARKGFKNEAVTESDIVTHALEVSTGVYARDASGSLIGFSSCVPESALGRTVIHLKGTVLLPEYQGGGLYPVLTAVRILREAERRGAADILIGTRTQSPIVYRFMSKSVGLHPKVDETIPEDLKPIAEAYAGIVRLKHSDFQSKHGLDFDCDQLIIRRAYGMVDASGNEQGFCMYGNNIPWVTDDEEVNVFIRSKLDLHNGDAILLIGPFVRKKNIAILNKAVNRLDPENREHAIVQRFAG